MSNLSASLEDYLEIICNLLQTSESVKAVEISRKLNVSRASVSEALSKLAEKELILYEGHKGITITEKGLKKAQEVISKHNTLTTFFENILCLDKEQAANNACKIYIIKQVENAKVKLTGMNTRTTKEGIAIIDISLELENKDMLNKMLSALRNIESVYDVNRKRG